MYGVYQYRRNFGRLHWVSFLGSANEFKLQLGLLLLRSDLGQLSAS